MSAASTITGSNDAGNVINTIAHNNFMRMQRAVLKNEMVIPVTFDCGADWASAPAAAARPAFNLTREKSTVQSYTLRKVRGVSPPSVMRLDLLRRWSHSPQHR